MLVVLFDSDEDALEELEWEFDADDDVQNILNLEVGLFLFVCSQ